MKPQKITHITPYRSGTRAGDFGHLRLEATMLTTGEDSRYRFNAGCVDEGDEGRKVMHGPMVAGPWAYSFGLGTCIDNHGGTAKEIEDAKRAGTWVLIKSGDVVEIGGFVYRASVPQSLRSIEFVPIKEWAR